MWCIYAVPQDLRNPKFSYWGALKGIKGKREEKPEGDKAYSDQYVCSEEARVPFDFEDSDVEQKRRVFRHCDCRLVEEFEYVNVLEG